MINTNRLYYIFFFFLILELFLCGSGQVIKLGPLTLRMLNFALAIILALFIAITHPIPKKNNLCLILYALYLMMWGGISIIFNDYKFVFEDIKPLSYFFIFLFFYYMIIENSTIFMVVKILKFSTLFLSIIYLIYIILIKSELIDFSVVYLLLSDTTDIIFRGTDGELFYKGFIFLPIGFLFFWDEKKYFVSAIILTAIYFTQTRGFYVITILGVFLHFCLTHKMKLSNMFALFILLALTYWSISYFELFEMGEKRDEGDVLRILTIEQVFDDITPFSFIWGHGFGKGVPIRQVHMEMSYLEIFHKQGIIGLIALIYLFLKIYIFWNNIAPSKKRIATLFFIGTCMIYCQSFFNPYINNPMGIGFILLTYFICYKLSKHYENSMCYRFV